MQREAETSPAPFAIEFRVFGCSALVVILIRDLEGRVKPAESSTVKRIYCDPRPIRAQKLAALMRVR